MMFSEAFFARLGSDIDESTLPIRAEQIRARLRSYPMMIVSQLLLAPLLVLLMWSHVSHTVLLAWSTVVVVGHGIEVTGFLLHQHATGTVEQCRIWRARFILYTFMVACTWGSVGVLMFVPSDLAYQALLICVLMGMAAGAVTINPVYPLTLYIYLICLLSPILFNMLLIADGTHLVLAAMMAMFLVFVLKSGSDLSRTFELSLQRSFDNALLVKSLGEEKLRAEQANLMKSKFFAAASHDLRQPMHALTLFVDVLKNRPHDEQSTQLVRQIEQSANVMGEMFDALLDLSKLDAGVVQPNNECFSVLPMLERLRDEFDWLARDKDLRLLMANCPGDVYTDQVLLERVLRNLISNAIRYTEQGSVAVMCDRVTDGLRISVKDSGIGIAPDQIKHIFEEYYQVGNPQRDRRRGLGLGLSIVSRLERLLGYRMEVESTLGLGSCFTFTVPKLPANTRVD
jgi:signal transduction histidine kinase